MKKRTILRVVLPVVLALVATAVAYWLWPRPGTTITAITQHTGRAPRIRPDYAGIVIPPNIAPLNFVIDEPGMQFSVRVLGAAGEPIIVSSHDHRIQIPMRKWSNLLEANRGGTVQFHVCVQEDKWELKRFAPITNRIAKEDVDRYLVYRLLKPLYFQYENMGIYQRDVSTFEESVVLGNQSIGGACVNCHAFHPNHADRMILHTRGGDCPAMILVRDGQVSKVDTRTAFNATPGAYTAWHPNGRVAAQAVIDAMLFFHSVGENRDVFDRSSDLIVYDTEANTVTSAPGIARADRFETFPAWSPDGRHLYFSSAPRAPFERFRDVRYDLMRIEYDPETGHWGKLECLLAAKDTGLSITEPRVSPDGRFVLFCMSDYGNFPVYQPSSDLYLLDIESRRYECLPVNSPRSESWHSWSSNSRWIAFASKRRDGLFARVYLSYIDEHGHAHKAVLLPQKDPTFYDGLIRTYNAPELTPYPAPATGRALARVARSSTATRKAGLALPAGMGPGGTNATGQSVDAGR
jgi:hypothetical protein